ncbi:MAG: N-acetylmuramoyl-L-alanine amidase, partial [Myxococcales bacterium]|nr:N-acetylmuramoyl-L-alanine amidase [Myxococcales bacterium]
RGLGIPCHFYVPKEPALVLCHDLERIVYHGHTANSFSAGIEITGVSDWDDGSQIERVRAILRYFKARRLAEVGADAPYYVMAHRQSHESRVNDPGKQIWQDAGEWAIKELGYQLGPVVGSGKTIDEWRS